MEKMKLKWITLIVSTGAKYPLEELRDMDVVELRDLYQELKPTYICAVQVTSSGGVSRSAVRLERKVA